VVDAQSSERGHSQSLATPSALSAAAIKRRYGGGERHFESRAFGQGGVVLVLVVLVVKGVDGEKRRVGSGSLAHSRDGRATLHPWPCEEGGRRVAGGD
jgi:hypothetical protein